MKNETPCFMKPGSTKLLSRKICSLLCAGGIGILLFACNPVVPPSYSLTDFPGVDKVYSDRTSSSILFSRESGFLLTDELIVRPAGSTEYEMKNFTPEAITGINIYARLKGQNRFIELQRDMTLDGHMRIKLKYPFLKERKSYGVEGSNRRVMMDAVPSVDPADIEFKLESSDPIFQKLKEIRTPWYIAFHNYNPGMKDPKSSWGNTKPAYVRQYTAVFPNMGYVLSSEEFKKAFLDYPFPLYSDAQGTPVKRDQLYKKFFDKREFKIGVTSKVGGLGGGKALGINFKFLDGKDYFKLPKPGQPLKAFSSWPLEVFSHELMHTFGYGHDGNMTYTQRVVMIIDPKTGMKAVLQAKEKGRVEVDKATGLWSVWNYKKKDYIVIDPQRGTGTVMVPKGGTIIVDRKAKTWIVTDPKTGQTVVLDPKTGKNGDSGFVLILVQTYLDLLREGRLPFLTYREGRM